MKLCIAWSITCVLHHCWHLQFVTKGDITCIKRYLQDLHVLLCLLKFIYVSHFVHPLSLKSAGELQAYEGLSVARVYLNMHGRDKSTIPQPSHLLHIVATSRDICCGLCILLSFSLNPGCRFIKYISCCLDSRLAMIMFIHYAIIFATQ